MGNGILSETSQPFRPRARVLQLLGDELIGSARLAVFKLVKNAYDADANEVVARLDLDSDQGSAITVTDDGEGMTLDVLRSVWLVPGDDHRQRQRLADRRTPRHRRLPLGEKGLGRFAVHKLGNRITLVTRARDSGECVVKIDWNELIAQPYLDEAPVTIRVRRPRVFTEEKTGTRIRIRQLRTTDWSRGEVRRLHNQSRPSAHRSKSRADSRPHCVFLAADTGSKTFRMFPRSSIAPSGSSRSASTTADLTGPMNSVRFQSSNSTVARSRNPEIG